MGANLPLLSPSPFENTEDEDGKKVAVLIVQGGPFQNLTWHLTFPSPAQHVGCDKILGSDVKEDKCRICGGDGSTCEMVKRNFTKTLPAGDYHEIFTIPRGSVHIAIEEMTVSRNYLGEAVIQVILLISEGIVEILTFF